MTGKSKHKKIERDDLMERAMAYRCICDALSSRYEETINDKRRNLFAYLRLFHEEKSMNECLQLAAEIYPYEQ